MHGGFLEMGLIGRVKKWWNRVLFICPYHGHRLKRKRMKKKRKNKDANIIKWICMRRERRSIDDHGGEEKKTRGGKWQWRLKWFFMSRVIKKWNRVCT